jgi:hypothetical protein
VGVVADRDDEIVVGDDSRDVGSAGGIEPQSVPVGDPYGTRVDPWSGMGAG